jgi:hypothetical protein
VKGGAIGLARTANNVGGGVDERVNLAEKLSLFSDRFAPRAVAEFNGHDVMVTKLEGEFSGTSSRTQATSSWSLRVASLYARVAGTMWFWGRANST